MSWLEIWHLKRCTPFSACSWVSLECAPTRYEQTWQKKGSQLETSGGPPGPVMNPLPRLSDPVLVSSNPLLRSVESLLDLQQEMGKSLSPCWSSTVLHSQVWWVEIARSLQPCCTVTEHCIETSESFTLALASLSLLWLKGSSLQPTSSSVQPLFMRTSLHSTAPMFSWSFSNSTSFVHKVLPPTQSSFSRMLQQSRGSQKCLCMKEVSVHLLTWWSSAILNSSSFSKSCPFFTKATLLAEMRSKSSILSSFKPELKQPFAEPWQSPPLSWSAFLSNLSSTMSLWCTMQVVDATRHVPSDRVSDCWNSAIRDSVFIPNDAQQQLPYQWSANSRQSADGSSIILLWESHKSIRIGAHSKPPLQQSGSPWTLMIKQWTRSGFISDLNRKV